MAQATAPILDSTKADIAERPINVRNWGKSGQHMLDVSFSAFDPSETWPTPRCCGAN
jgi:hypothetical protein